MRVRIGSSSIGGRVNIKSKLPSGYQEVEYLESPDVQYIDTGKTADSTSVIAFDFQYVSFNSSYNRIFGARNGEGKGLLNIRTSTTSGPYLLVENVHNWVSTTSIGTNKHSIKMDGVNHNLYYDYSVVSTGFTIKDDTLGNMWLFGTNQGGTDSNVRIFNYTHVKGGTLIQKLVPCVRISDNKPGMYDIITEQFLTNQGTGTFLKGSNINNIICKPHITIEGTTNLFPSQYQNGYYISGDSSSTITVSGQYSVPCTVQGKYTLSGYYKIASTDSATNPRITLSATYSDGTTATLKQDWNIVRDGTWRRFSITGTTNESKTLTTLKGWLFDYSTPGNARNIACKCVQLENKDHATLYTPTSRPDNTII